MIRSLSRLEPSARLLLGPGPSNVHARVSEALAKPIVGHLDPQFLEIMDAIQEKLRQAFRTENRLTLALSGTGSAGMEATLVNLIEPGDEALVCVNGVFGNRMSDIVERIGGRLHRIDRPWGEVFDPDDVRAALDAHPDVRIVAIVHAETSTGAWQPIEEIGRLSRETDRLLIVDAVTSFCGVPVEVDGWGIDAVYSGTQKCLSCPPGLAPVSFSPRALEKIRARRTKPVSWYLDLGMIEKYWAESSRAYHHTAPIAMNYALYEALGLVEEEGLEARWKRHERNSRALVAGLESLGFRPFAAAGHRLPMLNSVWLPEGVDDRRLRSRLLDEYDIEVGAGLGELAGKIWRVGLMGESSREENVFRFLGALEELLWAEKHADRIGAGLEAASTAYRS